MGSEEETLAAAEAVVAPIRGVDQAEEADRALTRAKALPARPLLSELAVGVVSDTLVKLLTGKIKVAKATEAKQLIETCYAIVRLEAGEATSITQMTTDEILADVKAIRDKARRDIKITPPKQT